MSNDSSQPSFPRNPTRSPSSISPEAAGDSSPKTPTTPTRSPSLRKRKPVPDLLHNLPIINTTLPPSHPFASSSPVTINGISPRTSSLPGSGRSSPAPKVVDDDVFVVPRSIPPPHRRTVSGLGIVAGGVPVRTASGHSIQPSTPTIKAESGADYDAAPAAPAVVDLTGSRPSTYHESIKSTASIVVETPTTASYDLLDILNTTPKQNTINNEVFPSGGSRGSKGLSLNHPLPPLPIVRTNSGQSTPRQTGQSWGVDEELEPVEVVSKSKSHKGKDKHPDEEFSVDRLPSKRKLWEAGTCFIRDENGELVCFGDFFPSRGESTEKDSENPKIRRTVVFFIRHFWCGQCQDYTFASLAKLDPVAIASAGIRVIVISNGHWKMIKRYRELFNCPFPIYVDGPRKLYALLGMTKLTNDFGPLFKGRAEYHRGRNVPQQLGSSLVNGLFRLPLGDPGKLTQLGGEFILSPGWNCEFAHRMTNTSNHMEAPEVVRLAGCAHPTTNEVIAEGVEESKRVELARLEEEMREWREGRESELERMRRKKAARRGVDYVAPRPVSQLGLGLDEELGDMPGVDDDMDARFAKALAIDAQESGEVPPEMDDMDARFAKALAIDAQESGEVPSEMDDMDARFARALAMDAEESGKAAETTKVTADRMESGKGNGLEVSVERLDRTV